MRYSLVVLMVAVSVGCSPASSALTSSSGSGKDGSENELLTLLEEFGEAWNRHDVDALMSMMTDDGVYEASSGPDVNGQRFEGQAAVREAFAGIFDTFPDAQWRDPRHVVSGDRGFSEWRFTGTSKDGTKVEVNGCDLFVFRDGKIAIKNSFRKNRTPATR